MNRDILYKHEDLVFSYRVGGILIQNGKILLQRPIGDDCAIIGGHVAALETTKQTLQREFSEELHADIQVGRLMAVGEIFFPWGKRPCHQICLYYEVHLSDPAAIPGEGSFWGYDDFDNQRIDLEYLWIPLEKLKEITVYPQELIPHIVSGSTETLHFISNQL